jgi:hypothetical protein
LRELFSLPRLALSAFVLAAVVAGALPELSRPGYSPDEEFTVFAVRGIAAEGLPVLPSGLLYDRGLLYSYGAWLAARLGGDELSAPRSLSLLSALAALLVVFAGVRQVSSDAGALLAVLLAATSLPFWVVATSARFYAPFLALYLCTLSTHLRQGYGGQALGTRFRQGYGGQALALSFLCRLTHELAFTLAAVPALCFVLSPRGERARWAGATVSVACGLGLAQACIFALHYLVPQSGDAMIRRFFLWQVLNLLGSPAQSLDFLWHIARTTPVMLGVTTMLMCARAFGAGGRWTGPERAVHGLWIGWVLFFGIIESGITVNYLLTPTVLMLAALAIDLSAIVRSWSASRTFRVRAVAAAAAASLVVGVAFEQWGARPRARMAEARPSIAVTDSDALKRAVAETQVVACTDELACLLFVGRVDRWLALDDYVRERFIVNRGGREVGVYAGAPVAHSLAALFSPDAAGRRPSRVLVIDVHKNLPVGPSSAFLTRALAEEGMRPIPIIESPLVRVVELDALAARMARALR